MKNFFILLWFLTLLLMLNACASVPYIHGKNLETGPILSLRPHESQLECGKPHAFVDGLGHYVLSLPSKLILWNWRVDNHNISEKTQTVLAEYLQQNSLNNVKVRINQYSPGDEWRRLVKNRGMPGFFRFTFGVLTNVYYTILPGRVFGGDNYNPFTNTINIYSDHPAIVLHEAAHAKDFALKSRSFRGWYALMRLLPGLPLYQEAKATGDAIGYVKAEKMPETEKSAYKILYPAYMTYIGGEALNWISIDTWISYAIQFGVAVPGHVVGRIKAANVDDADSGK
jgi:hypothetical protein